MRKDEMTTTDLLLEAVGIVAAFVYLGLQIYYGIIYGAELISIHKALFTGVLDHKIAGQIRDYDITKEEPILNGDTVVYLASFG